MTPQGATAVKFWLASCTETAQVFLEPFAFFRYFGVVEPDHARAMLEHRMIWQPHCCTGFSLLYCQFIRCFHTTPQNHND